MKNKFKCPAKSDSYETPDNVYDVIKKVWGYSKDDMFDPCPLNPIRSINGLSCDWKNINYVNPPYSLLSEFVMKAMREYLKDGKISILLLPAKTDQEWFHFLAQYHFDIVWIKGRLKFKHCKHHSMQPHFLVCIK